MKVLKFGGTSVGNAGRIECVGDILAGAAKHEPKLAVVVSAMGGVTDLLIDMAQLAQGGDESYREQLDELVYRHRRTAETLLDDGNLSVFLPYLKEKSRNLENLLNGVFLIRELSSRLLDVISSYGELVSSFMIGLYLQQRLPGVTFVDSRKLIKTDSSFGAAKVNFELTDSNILDALGAKKGVFVLGGFIASNEEGVTTTLGRGGSDYTAAIVAATLQAEELEIWTDVDGVMTADPRKVAKAFSIPEMTYEEALEMSHFGAKVLHPPTVQPALEKLVPIRIRNTFNPDFAGTLISVQTSDKQPVKGVSSIGKVALISVEGSGLIGVTGIAGRLFSALARAGANIILITQASSEHSICFAVAPKDAQLAKRAIEKEFALEMKAHLVDTPIVEADLSVIAVIGSNMKNTVGITGRLFGAMGRNGINVRAIAQGASELNISFVINNKDEAKALNALHEAFFLSGTKPLHLFLVGTGLIGATLLKQIERQAAHLLERQGLEIRLVAATNTRKMLFDENGLQLESLGGELEQSGEKADLPAFVERMVQLNMRNSIFVDCTASKTPIQHYGNILSHSISIVTPNKVANSGSMGNYLNYRWLASKHGVRFLYETNVGAGLPVISTLNDLLQSGDEIVKIEAVLSGSLSFIFNNFVGKAKFSDIVREAKERGFTEPDPRDDLSGMDVARKVLILSREIGKDMELKDVEVEDILPQACHDAATVDEFFAALEANDDHFAQLRNEAAAEGKVLRFMATITPETSKVELKKVDGSNPFYSLSGSDNMIVFTTSRYSERPLVVKGPGAGAEVTAAGVFAEIISIGSHLA